MQGKEGKDEGNKWSKAKGERKKITAAAQGESTNQLVTQKQVEQLHKLIPSNAKGGSETEEEVDVNFVGMLYSCNEYRNTNEWIIDTGTSDHMILDLNSLTNVIKVKSETQIKLPYGKSSLITHRGEIKLKNGLKLNNMLHVPKFKRNLLSVNKLLKDNKCNVISLSHLFEGGLYLHIDLSVEDALKNLKKGTCCLEQSDYNLWHNRLGHAPFAKLKQIRCVTNDLEKSGYKKYMNPLPTYMPENPEEKGHVVEISEERKECENADELEDMEIEENEEETPSENVAETDTGDEPHAPNIRRSERSHKAPDWMKDYVIQYKKGNVELAPGSA
ncbi:Retrovirus-related Pol polyprotein from transposon RE2, partial [Bienertia sinuspersici]